MNSPIVNSPLGYSPNRGGPFKGLQMGHWQNYNLEKKQIFGPKSRVFGPKKTFLAGCDVLAMTGKRCAYKKVPFSHVNISLLANLGCFFLFRWPLSKIKGTEWESCSPVYIGICTVDKSCDSITKNWLLAPNIQISWSKLHIFVPSDQLEP